MTLFTGYYYCGLDDNSMNNTCDFLEQNVYKSQPFSIIQFLNVTSYVTKY